MFIIICIILLLAAPSNRLILLRINCCICFFFLSGAYAFGYDWVNYVDFYRKIDVHEVYNSTFEPGFTLLLKLVHYLGLGYQYVVASSALIIIFCIYKYAKVFEKKNFVFFFLFSVFGYILFAEQIRQGIAMAIVLYAFSRQPKPSILAIFVATMFHYSAAVAMLFLLPSDLGKGGQAYKISIVALALCLVGGFLISVQIGGVWGDFIYEKIARYWDGNLISSKFFTAAILNAIFLVIILLSKKKLESDAKLTFAPAVIANIIIILATPFIVFSRISYYGYTEMVPALESVYRRSRSVTRLCILGTICILGLRTVVAPIYWPIMTDYKSYWIEEMLGTLPSYQEMINRRCEILKNNGVKNFCG